MTSAAVGPLEAFPDGGARRVEVEGRAVCVVRLGDRLLALDDTCSHEDYSLAEGDVDVEECAIECWKHGSLFSLESGEPLTLPATRPVAVHHAQVVDGEVVVTLGEAGR